MAMTTIMVESTSSLYFLKPFSLGVPRPGGLGELDFHFADEQFGLRDHRGGEKYFAVARQEGLEPPTDGFGDRYSTN